jgi:hypothetical protein
LVEGADAAAGFVDAVLLVVAAGGGTVAFFFTAAGLGAGATLVGLCRAAAGFAAGFFFFSVFRAVFPTEREADLRAALPERDVERREEGMEKRPLNTRPVPP